MPYDNSALNAGLASAVSTGLNAAVTTNLNKKNRKFAKEMYERQFADSLKLWGLQNEYNLPANQMQRFKDAGLNPNLIYGQGNEAGAPAMPDFKQPDTNAPQVDLSLGISRYYDTQARQAQVDNLREQTNILRHEAALTKTRSERERFDFEMESELRDTSMDYRRERLRGVRVGIASQYADNARKDFRLAQDYNESLSRLQTAYEQRVALRLSQAKTREEITRIVAESENARQQLRIIRAQTEIWERDARDAKKGVKPGDAAPFRWMTEFYNNFVAPDAKWWGDNYRKLRGWKD